MSFVLSHWMVWAALVLGWVGGSLRRPRRRPATAPSARPVWAPEVARARWSHSDFLYGSRTEPADHTVAVRIHKDDARLTIGTVQVAADDFEEQLQALTRAAEDKAAAMNAAELEVAA